MLNNLWIEFFMSASVPTQNTIFFSMTFVLVVFLIAYWLFEKNKEKQEFQQFIMDYYSGNLNYPNKRGNN